MAAPKTLIEQALKLSATDRSELIERLLGSLDESDPALDRLWASEVENRITAHDAGEIEMRTIDEVLGKYSK